MIRNNLNKLNSATKYPSILTYHDLGEKGCLKDSIQIPFEKSDSLIFTEKVDGTNTRIILFPDGGYFIGSREDLLTASGDLIYNPALGIVDILRPLVSQLRVRNLGLSVYVLFGEVYGAKVGSNGKKYTEKGQVGYRLFDVVTFKSEYDLEKFLEEKPIEEIASWRDRSGQTFLNEIDLQIIAHQSGIPLTPRITANHPPQEIKETMEWLKQSLPGNTLASIDGPGGRPEGVVIRTLLDRSKIAKLRFEDYERTLNKKNILERTQR